MFILRLMLTKPFTLCVPSALAFLAGCATGWPETEKMLHSDYDQYTPGWPEGDYGPTVLADGNGKWMVAWSGNSRVKTVAGADCPTGGVKTDLIYTTFSHDGGKTWEPIRCKDIGYDNDDGPALATDGKGKWVMVWQAETGLQKDYDLWSSISLSADWAKLAPASVWSLNKPVNTNVYSDSGNDVYPDVVYDGNGQWIAVWQSSEVLGNPNLGQDNDILYAVSSDGVNWSAPAALNSNAATDVGDDYMPHIASDGNGNLVVVWHSKDPLGVLGLGGDYDILYTRSSDGKTWTAPAPLNTNAASDNSFEDTGPDITYFNGRWIVAWTSDNPLGNTIGSDNDILFSYGTGTGVNWSAPASASPGFKTDTGNDRNARIACGTGRCATVWQSDDPGVDTNLLGVDDDILMSSSYDNGTTWYNNSAVHASAKDDQHGDKSPSVATDGQGHWIIVWSSEYDGPSGKWGLDWDILYVAFDMK